MLSLRIGIKSIALIAAFSWVMPAITGLPENWFLAGNRPHEYDCGVESVEVSVAFEGGSTASPDATFGHQSPVFLRSKGGIKTTGFGTLMYMFDAAPYLGKRVRFSGLVKAENVKPHGSDAWAGLWMRIDGFERRPDGLPQLLGFDNMHNRSTKGTKDWTSYSVVLDVPKNAAKIAMGILLSGAGAVWLNGEKFEVVGREVKSTGDRLYQAR